MQVKFHYVKFKNLLSYGNAETTIDLCSFKHTVVTAKNGAGKSSILDSICYALYGKPYRSIKLGQLVNSINKKNLVVTIEFSVGTDLYKVIRGQKPTIFEIYKNNELVLEDAASKDYQAYLETNVLKINFKTFKQIIVIGSASYVPFMNLTAAERRNITEDVLDISIFSSMQDIAKQKVIELKSTIDSLTYEIQLTKTQIDSQKELLDTLSKETASKEAETAERKSGLEESVSVLSAQIAEIDDQVLSLGDVSTKHDTLLKNKQKLDVKLARFDSRIESLTDSLALYDNASCPTCGQHISEELKHSKHVAVTQAIESCTHDRQTIQDTIKLFIEKIYDVGKLVKQHAELIQNRRELVYELSQAKKELLAIQDSKPTEGLELCRAKLKALVNSLVEKNESKNTVSKEWTIYKTAVDILKDNGIKAKVISTFIPILNQMINDYLQKFDMFVSFELDETFTEHIRSRDRDTFSYNSFSEGEKKRIDLGILFAWRKIAMSRNSVSTNLLIFDETMDSSLDEESVQTFIDILESIEENVNTIVISHRNVIPELFDRTITIQKVRDFSVLSQNV